MESVTTLISIRDHEAVAAARAAATFVYIGNQIKALGLQRSKWSNPFRIGPSCTREESLMLYQDYLRGRLELLTALPELRGKVLVCWCPPLACHGAILASWANEGIPAQ